MRSLLCRLALLSSVPLWVACQPPHKKMSTVSEERDVPLPANLPAGGPQAPNAAAAAAPAPAGQPAQAVTAAGVATPEAGKAPAAGRAPGPNAPAAPSEATLADARHFYVQRCALCHGPTGKGDGVAAANLRPQPRSFGEAGWQNAAKDADIAMVIVRGGTAIGRSMMMPASTDLAGRPEMVRALVAVVRGFGPPAVEAPAQTP